MKKLIALLVMASLFSLSIGCGGEKTSSKSSSTGVTKTTGATGGMENKDEKKDAPKKD